MGAESLGTANGTKFDRGRELREYVSGLADIFDKWRLMLVTYST